MPTVDRVREVVEPLVRARRCSLYDLELVGRGSTQILRVYIDRPGGVDTDTCATVSRVLSRALDEADVITGRYTLEVSSPGLERALRRPEHFVAVAGHGTMARIKFRDRDGAKVVVGEVTDARDNGIVLRTSDGEEVGLPYEAVVSARTVFTWGPAEPSGKGARR